MEKNEVYRYYIKTSELTIFVSLERTESLIIGTEVRTLFTPSSPVLLERAFGALQSQKLAGRAISHLQSLPGGDIKLLCDTVVESVSEFTGYDLVMDEHVEVVAERKRQDLDPYIGLHYPATDIPQASRVLFKQNRVRMIVDCHATPVRVGQDELLMKPLCLVGSSLRAPHGCHTQYMQNMGSIVSLTLEVIINGNDEEVVGGRTSMGPWAWFLDTTLMLGAFLSLFGMPVNSLCGRLDSN
ncbi:hypothetical protein RND71_014638 [Anisodus tanguticus]|uniref:Phytochrome chromophore attachment site domain-containing protein n=1 Tax=Anisodus tanguticus TaxID=243964 RepID=A0AAE1VE99_9SOLA|nr:hypothetical protein RND71_014638 [Anisodus tanguticus]